MSKMILSLETGIAREWHSLAATIPTTVPGTPLGTIFQSVIDEPYMPLYRLIFATCLVIKVDTAFGVAFPVGLKTSPIQKATTVHRRTQVDEGIHHGTGESKPGLALLY